MYKNILLILALIALATARTVKFSIVAFDVKNSVTVKIGSTTKTLTKYKNYVPVYQGSFSVSDSALTYTYYVDNVSDGITRTLAKGETTTHNEFFGRKDTVKTLPQFPQLYKWDKSVGKGELFDDSYIPTVHIYGDRSYAMFTTKPNAAYLEKIAFILKDNIYTFKNIAAYPKNKIWNKFQFKVQLNNDGIEGRYTLKFRDNNEDPTFMRQDLYGDIMNALGYPTIQSIKTRVYVNEKPVGYYILQEEAASDSFVRSAFHGSNGKLLITEREKLGHPLDCSTGADFYYTGNDFYSFKAYNSTLYNNSRVKNLCKEFEKLNVNNASQLATFEKKWFDIDTFFKAIAMQYLTGHWDSYWFFSTNFALYDDPTESTSSTNKFYFICQDWDGTFGLNFGMPYMRYDDFYEHSYKDFVNIPWGLDDYDAPNRYAIDKLLSNAKLRARFEAILTNIVKNIFNPISISKRLDALVERHRDEIAWNYETINKHPLRKGSGTQLEWTMEDFETNINTRSRHGASQGIKEFVYRRAKLISEEFGLNIDLGKETYGTDISYDGRCGEGHGKCPNNECCSAYGYCGSEADYCSNCQADWGYCPGAPAKKTTTSVKKTTTTTTVKNTTTVKKTTTTAKKTKTTTKNTKKTTTTAKKTTTKTSGATNISTDGTCGANKGRCPSGQCCSKYGYCGTTTDHCSAGCQSSFGICSSSSNNTSNTGSSGTDYTKIESKDGTCGSGKGRCPSGQCCSKYGYCGTTNDHCKVGCQASYGLCI